MTRYRSEIIISLFLVASILAVYWQVRHHEFIKYDDPDYVSDNPHVRAGWTREGVSWAFRTTFHYHWHPLTWLSHMTDYQLFGLNPTGHHLTSLFLHIANTLLLFLVFEWMTGSLLRSAFVAALFALHPLHVESVAWVSDRKDVLSTFFWMVTMVAYVHYSGHPGFNRYALVTIAFILGLMAKPMVVTLPIILLLMDYWPLERFQFGQSRRERRREKCEGPDARYQTRPALRLVWEKGLFFLIVGASAIVTILVMRHESILTLKLSRLWPTKSLIAETMVNYVTYIAKMLWPLKLAIPYPESDVPAVWQVGGAGLLLLGISLLSFWQRRQRPYLLVGWLWYLITLLPVIGLVGVGPHKMADRYTYLPLIGLFIIIAWGVPDLLAGWRHRRLVLGISVGMLLLGCMTGSWLQARHWKNSISLFGHGVTVTSNNLVAHNNLGSALAEQGSLTEAIGHYYEALRIEPGYADAHYNLANALAEQGRLQEAIDHYSEALQIRPRYAQAHYNLGLVLAEQGRLTEAMGHFSEALRIDPDYAQAHYNLGVALVIEGKLTGAIKHFSEALRIDPDYAQAHYNLGLALTKEGRVAEGIEHYSEALRIQPDNAKAHHQLGIARAKQGRLKEAIGHFSEALRIQPDYTKARQNLERASRLMGKPPWGSDGRLTR
jgi:Flp pilus assembly protein TadD